MSRKIKMTVAKTGVITYYAVNLEDSEHTVTDLYDANADYTERSILELEPQKEPNVAIQDQISK